MAVQGLLGWGSVMVGRMRAFVVANEMCRVRVSVVAAVVFHAVSKARCPLPVSPLCNLTQDL